MYKKNCFLTLVDSVLKAFLTTGSVPEKTVPNSRILYKKDARVLK